MRRRLVSVVAAWVLAGVVVAAVARPEERCPEVTAAGVQSAVDSAVAWFLHNQLPDGRWRYLYDRAEDEDSPDYNIVRHSGVLLSLYQAAAGNDRALAVADRGLVWAQGRMVEDAGLSIFSVTPIADTGASALLVNALAERRLVTDDPRYDRLLRSLGRFLAAQVTDSGAVEASWDTEAGAPVVGSRSRYFTGQVMWGLARLHRLFPDEGWDVPAREVSRYIAEDRDRVEPRFPPLADHWAAYGLDEIAHWPERPELTTAERRYARYQAAAFSSQSRVESQRREEGIGNLMRASIGSASGTGTLGEGLGALHRLAGVDDELVGLTAPTAERLRCIAGLLVDRQVEVAEADDHPHPERLAGAWFRHDLTRMDDQQHAVSALLASLPTLETTDP